MKMHFDGEALRYLDNLTLRMQKAEAEVERLQAENARLRRVVDAAREIWWGSEQSQWKALEQAFVELDKEDER